MRPIHPGEIVRERRGITPDTALRLAAFFGGDASSWLNLQQAFDLKAVDDERWHAQSDSYCRTALPSQIST